MYARLLRNAEHVRRFTIRNTGSSWEVVDEHDDSILKRAHYHDWHRVERAMWTFSLEAALLHEAGWTETSIRDSRSAIRNPRPGLPYSTNR